MIGPYWKGTQQAASSLPPNKEPTTALVSTEHGNTAEKAKEKDNLMNISTGDSNGTTEEDRMSNSTKSLFKNELPQSTHQSLTKKPLVALKRRTFRNTTAGHDEGAPDWKRQKRSKPPPTKTPLQNKEFTKSPVVVSVEDHHTMQTKGSSWMGTGVKLFAATQDSKPSNGWKRGPYDDCDI